MSINQAIILWGIFILLLNIFGIYTTYKFAMIWYETGSWWQAQLAYWQWLIPGI